MSTRLPNERFSPSVRRKKKSEFLEAFRRLGTVAGASDEIGIDRSTHHYWQKTDLEYAAKFEELKPLVLQMLEDECHRRAVHGVEEPVFQGGQEVGRIRRYSDTLLIFRMKGEMPDKYKDRVSQEISGSLDIVDRLKAARGRIGDGEATD